ncbi:RAVE protein 1 C terminal-domain-containing protein [Ganoderma leucocontextum]|nr:RAVE protein 1 C terminal-domain-containing protein [Ganoderma leucocontextum]
MLELVQSYTGCPPANLQFLLLPRETLLLYPFADSVAIFNARTLAFVRALAFWEIFPSTRHIAQSVKCLTVENSMKLVVASLGHRLVAWSLSGPQNDYWRVHSSLQLSEDQHVTALNCISGLLAVATRSSLSVYTLILENDLPTWSLKWSSTVPALSLVRFSPSLMYMSTTSLRDNVVRIYLTTTGRQTQAVPHPRHVMDLIWRNSPTSNRDDPILYTITADATLRIFMPVLDAPQHLQLHSALDTFSSLPFSVASRQTSSGVFWLDREIMTAALKSDLPNPAPAEEDARRRRVREISEEGWDVFLRVLGDGSLVVQAIANIDRRPPTLLKQFTLLQTAPGILPGPPSHLHIAPNPKKGTLTLVTSPPLISYELSVLPFFDARAEGLKRVTTGAEHTHTHEFGSDDPQAETMYYVRTPNGEGVGLIRSDGCGEVWTYDWAKTGSLERTGKWLPAETGRVDHFVVIDAGRYFATYSSETGLLTLHTSPSASLSVPSLSLLFVLSAPHSNPVRTLVGVTASQTVLLISATLSGPSPSLMLVSQHALPLAAPPKMVLPVDPMAWVGQLASKSDAMAGHDVLLSVSEDGELAFWIPENVLFISTANGDARVTNSVAKAETVWKCTGKVRTGKKGITMASCSSAKKSCLVVSTAEGDELTIWDSKESEFSLGLEFRQVFSALDSVNDLDWTATPDNQSILAVGFAHRIELLCEQRATYFAETPGWGVCWKLDMGSMIPHPISDSIWLARGTLLVGAGHLMFMYGQKEQATLTEPESESLFEHVARLNGPLDDWNPQMILQCLLWGKVELVKKVIINLARNVESGKDIHDWENLPIEQYLSKEQETTAPVNGFHKRNPKYSSLFNNSESKDVSDEDPFSPQAVQRLLDRLEEQPIPHLTPKEHASLLVLIQTTLEIQQQRRALDPNGLRYLISMRSFYILNRRASEPSTPTSMANGTITVTSGLRLERRERLRYRDMIWAFHSESQDLLLSMSVAACSNGKMAWAEARALGVFTWMRSREAMRSHMEVIARNEYMAGDNRDPTACSLFYFALGKAKLVHGLWRQAAWHKEQQVMLKFLNNDFNEPRWRTAAQKNAFALLSKRRFEYAAAFFLLGGSLKDAVSVCLKNVGDWQLAVALARVVEGDDGPILRDILNGTVVPLAFKDGNRYLASWAFWLLRRRDLAVRILVNPLEDVASALETNMTDIGDPHYDDPSLALLFSQLKSKTLQTAQGTSEISGRTEFNFVLQIARVFCKMGCHALALDLVRSWSFQRPSTVDRDSRFMLRPRSPISTRFALEPALRHNSSILIDIDVTTAPPTRRASPTRSPTRGASPVPMVKEEFKEEGDLVARKAGIGSLMKSAKQDVKVPEFDMNAFF